MDIETAVFVHEQLGQNSLEATKLITTGLSALHNLSGTKDENAIFCALKSVFNISHSDKGEFKHLRIASEKLATPLEKDKQRQVLLNLYKSLRT